MPEREKQSNQMTMKEALDSRVEILARTRSVGELFEAAEMLAMGIMFSPFVQGMPEKVAQFTVQTTPQHLEKALKLHNLQGVPEESDDTQHEYQTLLQANSFKEHIARELIRATIAGKNKLHLTPTQRKTLFWGTKLQDTHDKWFIQWRDEVTNGPTYKELKRLQAVVEASNPQAASDFAWETYIKPTLSENGQGFTGDFLYSVPRIVTIDGPDKNKIVPTPYAHAFPQEIAEIARTIDEMVADLQPDAAKGDKDAQGLIATHLAYKALLTYPPVGEPFSASRQEELAKELDRVWVTQAKALDKSNVIQIFYSMEAYGEILKKLVEPEYTIAFKDKRYRKINTKADRAKKKTLQFFRNSAAFSEFTTLQESLPVMQDSSALVYSILNSGSALGFRPAAANVPNRPEIRQKYGTKIYMNLATNRERAEIVRGFLQNLFSSRQFEKNFSQTQKLQDMFAGVFVALHEVGHNAFVVADTITKMTSEVYSNLEEAKSDLIGIVGALSFLKGKDRSVFVRSLFAEELRGMTRRAEATDKTHLYGNILNLNMLLDAGIVRQKNGEWVVDDSEKNISKLEQLAQQKLIEMAQVYEAKSSDMGKAYIATNFEESPTLLELEKKAGIITSEA